jgi:molybdate transport system substrate-binding protein
MRKITTIAVVLLVLALAGAGTVASQEQAVTVSAAISLKDAFEKLGKLFEAQNKNVSLLFNFGASGSLAAQIAGGAPVDVFASAARKDMDDLEKGGFIVPGTRKDFAANDVVLAAPRSSKIVITSFNDLRKPEIRRIAIGDPKTVPAGRYAGETLRALGLFAVLKEKLVFTVNVRQALDYAARGEVDAAVVYATDAQTSAGEVAVAAIAPAGSHKPVVYPLALVKGAKNEKAARGFISFILSDEGQKVLAQYGFRRP